MFSTIPFCSFVVCLTLVAGVTQAAEPLASIKLTIPDYTVSKVGEQDEVTIPDGQVLAEEGRPQVPYSVKTIGYPKGFRIQEVLLKGRSGMKTDSGLKLPIIQPDTGQVDVIAGVYPLNDYDWKAFYNEDSPTTLFIYIYPFYYDPTTTKIQFYKNYAFEIRYVATTVAIGSIGADKPVYDPGEQVKLGLRLENSGKVQEVTVAASIFKAFSNEKVADLPAKSLKKLAKVDSVTLNWSTGGFPTGNYEAEVVVKDHKGNELDRGRTLFRFGNPQGEVTDFKVTPQQFKIGEPVALSMEFKNTGTCDLTGEGVFRIMTADALVDEFHENMAALKPGTSTSFQKSWRTDNAKQSALYYAIGYVTYEGGSSNAKSLLFSTNLMPTATFTFSPENPTVGQEIKFDASASTDQDGKIVKYKWEFDDGAQAADSVITHAYHQTDDYTVRLTVTDNEGGTATAVQKLSIKN